MIEPFKSQDDSSYLRKREGFPGIAAVILAAGQSRRMGQPKLTLPWGDQTVITKIVDTLYHAGVTNIVVVTGGARSAVEAVLADLPVQTVFNQNYEQSEMVASLQLGLKQLGSDVTGALVVLGDQPTIENGVIRAVVGRYLSTKNLLVVPSYQMRRGHPWLVDRNLWNRIYSLKGNDTLRDFLTQSQDHIEYVNVDSPDILKDLDTPEDYQNLRPR